MDKANKNSSKTESPQHVVTETGDVLVTTTNTIRAVVDLQGGRFLANGVYRLRLDTTRCNPAYVAFCLQAQWNQDQLMGSGILRADIKSLEIPLIPLDEQQQVVALLSAMADAQRDAETAAAAARTMTGVVLDAVRYDVSMALGNE
jgi:restriction endonuclease S subunit